MYVISIHIYVLMCVFIPLISKDVVNIGLDTSLTNAYKNVHYF